jgi:hypothetical protein
MLQMEGNLDGISHIFVDEVRCCFLKPAGMVQSLPHTTFRCTNGT